MASRDRPETAFILSLIAGLLIIVGGVIMILLMSMGFWWMGMYGGHYSMMGFTAANFGLLYALLLFGIVCGAIVIVSSAMLYRQPGQHSIWGAIILAFSLLSLIGMGGFFVGAVVGIVGGTLAITWSGAGRAGFN